MKKKVKNIEQNDKVMIISTYGRDKQLINTVKDITYTALSDYYPSVSLFKNKTTILRQIFKIYFEQRFNAKLDAFLKFITK